MCLSFFIILCLIRFRWEMYQTFLWLPMLLIQLLHHHQNTRRDLSTNPRARWCCEAVFTICIHHHLYFIINFIDSRLHLHRQPRFLRSFIFHPVPSSYVPNIERYQFPSFLQFFLKRKFESPQTITMIYNEIVFNDTLQMKRISTTARLCTRWSDDETSSKQAST